MNEHGFSDMVHRAQYSEKDTAGDSLLTASEHEEHSDRYAKSLYGISGLKSESLNGKSVKRRFRLISSP